jgi:two-component system, NarL family, nitrate/nitrite response regulator NarL
VKLVVFSASQPFKRHLTNCLETSFEFHSRLQAPSGSSQQIYLLHLSSMKAAGLEWMLKQVSARPVTVAACSDLPEVGEMLECVRLGASAYCNSHMAAIHYQQMLRLLAQGQSWFPPHMLEETFRLAQRAIQSQPSSDLLQQLTERESQIAMAVSEGKSNRQIAQLHAISEATVKSHLTNVFRKLEIKDRVGLVLLLKQD